MSTQTLEFITDAELQAASGGGFMSAAAGLLRRGAGVLAHNPKATAEVVGGVVDAVTSKGQLQDLQLGIA